MGEEGGGRGDEEESDEGERGEKEVSREQSGAR